MIWSTTKDCARTDHGIATLAGFSPSSQDKPCFNMVFLTSLALRLSSNRRSGITGFVIGGGWQIQKERQGRTRVLLLCCCNVIPPYYQRFLLITHSVLLIGICLTILYLSLYL